MNAEEGKLRIRIAARVGVALLTHRDVEQAESEAVAILNPLVFKASGGLDGPPSKDHERLARFARTEIRSTFLRAGRRWPA